MGRHRKKVVEVEEEETDTESESPYTYTLMPDTKSPFSCCCICYRYLLDICLVLAISPFVINCFLEAIIYLIKFDWGKITWGSGILALIVVCLWISMALFGILCCMAVVKKGVFTRRLRQKRKGQDGAIGPSPSEMDDSLA